MSKDSKVEDIKDYIDGNDLSTRAIQIEAIATNETESDFLKEETISDVEDLDVDGSKYKEYEKALKDLLGEDESEYVDAFENIVYLEDLEGVDTMDLDGSTDEVFPGVRILKPKKDEAEEEDEW